VRCLETNILATVEDRVMFHDAKSRLFYELRIDVATAKGKGKQTPTCQESSKNVDVYSRKSQAMAKTQPPLLGPLLH